MRRLHFVAGNEVRLLHCGAEFFPVLLREIDAAQHEVYLETYIFAGDDATATQVRVALQRAAARGVAIRVVLDWVGSGYGRAVAVMQALRAGGVDCRCFNPWFRRGLARTHRKVCVVDQRVALIGGVNIIDDYVSDDDKRRLQFARWDFAAQVQGPLVRHMHLEVEAQWRRTGKLDLLARFELLRNLQVEAREERAQLATAAFVVRDNLRNRFTIQKAYLQALGTARKTALLANPYFAPGRKFRNALIQAAARGVDVVLLLGVGQFALQDAVTHSFYPKLLKNGVRIVEYRRTQLHAKVAVIDDAWATVGSSNFDGLSLFVNHEANLVIRDPVFAHALSQHLQQGIRDGVEILASDYDNQPWYRRAWYGTAYLVYRGLMRIVTLGGYA